MLDGIRRNDPQQWDRFVQLFGPVVYSWCRKNGISEHDSADIVQEVFQVVSQRLDRFRRKDSNDTFHGWLFGVTRHKCLDHFRKTTDHVIATGGSTAHALWQQTPQPEFKDLDEEQINNDKQTIFRRALNLIQTDFEPQTWKAFWRVTVDGVKPDEVASELGMTTGAIYNAKYKVNRKLKLEFQDLIPE